MRAPLPPPPLTAQPSTLTLAVALTRRASGQALYLAISRHISPYLATSAYTSQARKRTGARLMRHLVVQTPVGFFVSASEIEKWFH